MMLLRANVIAKGYSGARPELVELLAAMLNAGLYPPIPGAGKRRRERRPRAARASRAVADRRGHAASRRERGRRGDMLRARGSRRWRSQPKEGITLINGTQAHTAIAALALVDAQRLWRMAHVAGAMSLEGLLGHAVAFDARIQRRARPARPGARPRRCCARCSPTARSASRIATAIRACRTRTRCAACRRCTARCSTRSTSPNRS